MIAGIFFIAWEGLAQQIPLSTLYFENPFMFNPALAGTDRGFKLRMDNRFQWVGFEDAPITNILSAYGPHRTKNIGYGGNIGYDATGPTSRFTMNGAFASNFVLTSDLRISLGINLGFLQYRADGTKLELDDPSGPQILDPYAPAKVMSSFLPDAGAGVYLYHHDWYIGISAQQLFNNNIKFSGEDSNDNKLKTHFYGYGGYRFSMGRNWLFEPTILLTKVLSPVPFQMDLTPKIIYQEKFWAGVNVRNTFESFEDISIILGYIHDKRVHIALAYDYTLSTIGKYNSGTIELTLGYNFDAIRRR